MIRGYETVSALSEVIAIMDEVKRLHRMGQIDPLLDRYSALRKALIGVRRLSPTLSESMDIQIQSAIATLVKIEDAVERVTAEGSSPDYVQLNRLLSRNIDGLYSVLIEMTAIPTEHI